MPSRDSSQSSQSNETVQQLQAQAAEDYRQHNNPETQAAAREQAGWAQVNGNAAAGGWRGHR